MPQPVSIARARELFALCNSQICCPSSSGAPCIPFLFPDDGCWARAHQMCRLMIAAGGQPEKVWIRGRLLVISQNKPNCQVRWGYHVAPTLQVRIGTAIHIYVIDPALFNEPVPESAWKAVQSDPSATLTHTSADQYGPSGGTDPTYSSTATDLQTYRDKLKLRSASSEGPPPYTMCMTKPAGTQWVGLIEPNQKQLWFTWGWPRAVQVHWNVMPLTPCPGNPQLSLTVEVEKANTTQVTYWLTVANLTADRVRFAGRYNVIP